MSRFRPKYVTFDCYGTLTNFEMAEAARDLYGAVLPERAMADFINIFVAYRLDEILGAWKPYAEVVSNALARSCRRIYDLTTVHDLGITNKFRVNRGHEPANPYYGYVEIKDISRLPGVFGL